MHAFKHIIYMHAWIIQFRNKESSLLTKNKKRRVLVVIFIKKSIILTNKA